MIKKVLVCASLVALATSAFAVDTGAYVRGDVGFLDLHRKENSITQKHHNKPIYSLGLGYRFNKNFRADVNGHMTKSKETDKVHYKSKVASISAYYDFDNSSMFTPYLKAGLYYSHNKLTSPLKKTTHTNGYSVGVGSLINVAENVDLDFVYKRVIQLSSGVSVKTHKIAAGVIFGF